MKILITGTTSGIGKTLSAHLQSQNHEILHLNRDQLDLSRINDVKLYEMPNCDVLINNAGVDNRDNVIDADFDLLEKSVQINLLSPIILSSKFAKKNPTGTIINITSSCINSNRHDTILYSVSKFALHKFTELFRNSNYQNSLRVVELVPGKTKTSMSIGKDDFILDPSEIADTVDFILKNKNINQIYIKSY